MPWCPICKNEYKEGYTHCSDCNVDLVDKLPVPVMFGGKEEMEQMQQVLAGNLIYESYISFDEKERHYELSVVEEQAETAKEFLKNYLEEEELSRVRDELGEVADALLVEGKTLEEVTMERAAQDEQKERTQLYGDKKTRAEDYKSSAYTLALVGGGGILFLVLHALGLIPLSFPGPTRMMLYGVMGVMFVIFLVSAVLAWKSYKRLLVEDVDDKALIEEAKAFLSEITVEQLDAKIDLSDTPDEMKYFKRMPMIKKLLEEKFPDMAAELVEHLADEYYDEHFGTDYDTTEADSFVTEGAGEESMGE